MAEHLTEGETLLAGQQLQSSNGKFVAYMSALGYVTLYRFEAVRGPVELWRFACFHQRPHGDVWMGIRNGVLMGGDHRYPNRPETSWWSRPIFTGGPLEPPRPSNPILVVQDDGNMVLYSRGPQGQIGPARFATNTSGAHAAAIDPSLPTGVVRAGTLAIDANTIIVNSLASPITVSDGIKAVKLPPQASVGAKANAGPGTLAIDLRTFVYDLETGRNSGNAMPHNMHTTRSGNTIRIENGAPTPVEWNATADPGFSHLQLPWEAEELAKTYEADNAEPCDEPKSR